MNTLVLQNGDTIAFEIGRGFVTQRRPNPDFSPARVGHGTGTVHQIFRQKV